MQVRGRFHATSAFTPGQRVRGTYGIEDWTGHNVHVERLLKIQAKCLTVFKLEFPDVPAERV